MTTNPSMLAIKAGYQGSSDDMRAIISDTTVSDLWEGAKNRSGMDSDAGIAQLHIVFDTAMLTGITVPHETLAEMMQFVGICGNPTQIKQAATIAHSNNDYIDALMLGASASGNADDDDDADDECEAQILAVGWALVNALPREPMALTDTMADVVTCIMNAINDRKQLSSLPPILHRYYHEEALLEAIDRLAGRLCSSQTEELTLKMDIALMAANTGAFDSAKDTAQKQDAAEKPANPQSAEATSEQLRPPSRRLKL